MSYPRAPRPRSTPTLATLAALLFVGCAREARVTAPSRERPISGELELLEIIPSPGQRRVPTDSKILLCFDQAVDPDAQLDDSIALYDGSTRVPTRLVRGSKASEIAVVPRSALRSATWYELRVSPLVCDRRGLILDRSVSTTWRSEDREAPRLLESKATSDGSFRLGFNEPTRLDGNALRVSSAKGRLASRVYALSDRSFEVVVTQLDAASSVEFELPAGSFRDIDGNESPTTIQRSIDWPPMRGGPRLLSQTPQSRIAANGWLVLRFDRVIKGARVAPQSTKFETRWSSDRRRLAVRAIPSWSQGAKRLVLESIVDRHDSRAERLEIELHGVSGMPPLRSVSSWPAKRPRGRGQRHPFGERCEFGFDRRVADGSLDGHVWLDNDNCRIDASYESLPDARRVSLNPRPRQGSMQPVRRVPGSQRIVLAPAPFGPLDALGVGLNEAVELDFEVDDEVRASSTLRPLKRLPANDGPHPATLTPVLVFDQKLGDLPATALRLSRGASQIPYRIERLDAARSDHPDASALRIVPERALEAGAYTLTLPAGLAGPRAENGSCMRSQESFDFVISPQALQRVELGIEGVSTTHAVLGSRGAQVSVDCGPTVLDPWRSSLVWTDARGSHQASAAALWRRMTLPTMISTARSTTRPTQPWTAIDIDVLSGRVECRLQAFDLAGRALGARVGFDVDGGFGHRAFGRTNLVCLRFDQDRDKNGVSDFAEDLELFGLTSRALRGSARAAWIESLEAEIVARSHRVFGRSPRGERLEGSCALRLTRRWPGKALHGSVAIGGLDPRGRAKRDLNSPSSGVLGRARYDARNVTSDETLDGEYGVFVRELLLWQLDNQRRLGRSVRTPFSRSFGPFVRSLGGVPVGEHGDDHSILSASFDYERASPGERARFESITTARDDFVRAIAHVLAHELGHSFGLVAEGPPQGGLDGNASLHVARAEALDLMASASTWLQLVDPALRFRPLSRAWLRNRILLR